MSDDKQKEVFARNLNKYLERSGKTQKEVAQAIGVIPTTFNTWCLAQALPRMGKVQLLADYFGINKSDLIEDNSDTEYYLDAETAKKAQEIFENKQLSLLFDAARDAKPEDLEIVQSMLLALKNKDNK
ncbi:XRE family transcriptional regulator [Coprococcus sp. AF38-1]|uniref:helix-turn-helix domain-containing protein n=1 Tax=Coprococcus sp. AF38-1 TaxID=2302943 RepID=UPI000E76D4E7|nr:helix-turn-helix transcriptional regulator [Coprococcus sp. AF38-1]RJW74519.1 XRE family transcriptional regulator [Coprococcus sp. AF38-1]